VKSAAAASGAGGRGGAGSPRIVLARLAHAVVVVVLAVVSFGVAVAGVLVHAWRSPFGLVLALAAAVGMCLLARDAGRTRLGIGVVGTAWLLPVLVLAQPRPGGDVLIESNPTGLMFLFGGVVPWAVVLGMGAVPRGSRKS
jgi:uncharacterized membrane protein